MQSSNSRPGSKVFSERGEFNGRYGRHRTQGKVYVVDAAQDGPRGLPDDEAAEAGAVFVLLPAPEGQHGGVRGH